ncbi:MAG: GMC family oxidoreductase N-terminal domain-containing protein [Burkholderiaceae bacterium]|jgi:choline dehydrogenase
MGREYGSFDYIIVGGGTSGCLLANRLSADPDVKVLLLEAGRADDYIWIHIPVGYLYCIGNPRTDWRFQTEKEAGLNGRSLLYPRGRVLGGCSSINGMIYMRGQSTDYDHWRDLGNAGWGWDDVLPLFKKTEDYAGGADEFHGAKGEWRVEPQRLSWTILDAFCEAAAQAGIPKVIDFNRGDNEGSGYFEVNQRGGVRWNASKAFLRPVLRRPNLSVATEAHVSRLTLSGKRVTGVEFLRGGLPFWARAQKETILAAGAIGSPHLLQASGIGPGQLLADQGIEVIGDLEGVGANLQDHLQLRMAFKVKKARTLNTLAATALGKARIGLEYALFRRGPMAMAPSQLGVFARSDPRHRQANVEYHVQPLSLERFGEPLHAFPAFTASVCNLKPQARGTVRLKAADTRVAPAIQPNYLSTEEDRRVAAESIRLTRRIVGQPALAQYEPEEFMPGLDWASDEELAKAAGAIGTTIFHPVGTCKMGRDPQAVVDERLRVHGVQGLRVVDASIMPTITSGNTCSPTVMIAEKASLMILEDRKKQGAASNIDTQPAPALHNDARELA